MERQQPIVIDDVAAALGQMTMLGRQVMQAPAALVRDAVLLYAARRGWKVVRHDTFSDWVRQQLDRDYLWLILDPMIPPGSLDVQAVPVRLTRRPIAGGWIIDDDVPEAVKERLCDREIGIVDDAAATGATLRKLADVIAAAGGMFSDVIVCASTVEAREVVRCVRPECAWAQLYGAPARPMHVRDGCPLLPHSGRRLDTSHSVKVGEVTLRAAKPPMHFTGGLWHEVSQDRAAAGDIRKAWRMASYNLSRAFGRPATVADIPLLGENLAVPVFLKPSATSSTPMDELLA